MRTPPAKSILYCRRPGLITQAARSWRGGVTSLCPLAVTEGRQVRDASLLALAQGVKVGMAVAQARRLCPTLLTVPLEDVDVSGLRRMFLDILADLSPVVEPVGPDAAYVDMTGAWCVVEDVRTRLEASLALSPVIGLGVSCLAARASAESGENSLGAASVEYLWPDDPAVVGRLQRLGLTTFGAVADVGEEALRLHFGKISPVLHRRAQGVDLTPVRALYPPPKVELRRRFDDAVNDRTHLDAVLAKMSAEAERQLRDLGGHGKRIILHLQTERGHHRQEWVVPAPVATAEDVRLAAGRLLAQMRLTAPVTAMGIDVTEVSPPLSHTPDLFCDGPGRDPVALEAVRRRLASRFGLTTITAPAQWPKTARQKRRSALQERWQGVRA